MRKLLGGYLKISSKLRTMLRDLAIRPVRASCYSPAALSSTDFITLAVSNSLRFMSSSGVNELSFVIVKPAAETLI